jgi:hypothetical protein
VDRTLAATTSGTSSSAPVPCARRVAVARRRLAAHEWPTAIELVDAMLGPWTGGPIFLNH